MKRIVRKIKNYIWTIRRNKINKINRNRLNENAMTASIISMNCIGGIISHDLGMRFLSPTVNLYMKAEDFIRFCENLEYYLSVDKMVECTDKSIIGNRNYPIAYLDDIILYLVHYNTVAEAQEKWSERKKRINMDNIVVINTDREGLTDSIKDRFELLPYRKVLFTNKPDNHHKSCFYIKGYEREKCVGIITDHNTWDGKRPIDQYDYVGLLNREL